MEKGVLKKWKETGLLNGFDEHKTLQMAQLYESQMLCNKSSQYRDNSRKLLFNRISIPLVRKVYGELLLWDLISIQSMGESYGVHYYKDGYNNLKTRDISCRVGNLSSYIPIIKAQPGLESIETEYGPILVTEWSSSDNEAWYVEGEFAEKMANSKSNIQLDNEYNLVEYVSEQLIRAITSEVLNDIRNNANEDYKEIRSPSHLVDVIFNKSEYITRHIGRSANWLVASPQIIIEIIKSGSFTPIEGFVLSPKNVQYVGNLGKIKTYVDPKFPQEVLLGYKGDAFESSYFYCPFIPFVEILENEECDRYRLCSRYAKRLLNDHYFTRFMIV